MTFPGICQPQEYISDVGTLRVDSITPDSKDNGQQNGSQLNVISEPWWGLLYPHLTRDQIQGPLDKSPVSYPMTTETPYTDT
jgi:hypothetical protein